MNHSLVREIETLKVGISDIRTVSRPHQLKTIGLGSCIGLIVFDDQVGMAGMAHIMLPNHQISKQPNFPPGKYVDTATRRLYHELIQQGSVPGNLRAKMAGGAHMFKFSRETGMRIGDQNISAVKHHLKLLNIALIAEDTGGDYGRTLEFSTSDLTLKITSVNRKPKII